MLLFCDLCGIVATYPETQLAAEQQRDTDHQTQHHLCQDFLLA